MKFDNATSFNNHLSSSEALNLYLCKQFHHDMVEKHSNRPCGFLKDGVVCLPSKNCEATDTVEVRMSKYLSSQPYLSYKAILLADAMYNVMHDNVVACTSSYVPPIHHNLRKSTYPSDIYFRHHSRPITTFNRCEKRSEQLDQMNSNVEFEHQRFHVQHRLKDIETASSSSSGPSSESDFYQAETFDSLAKSATHSSNGASTFPFNKDGIEAFVYDLRKRKENITSMLNDIQRLTREPNVALSTNSPYSESLMSRAQIAQARRGVTTLASLVDCDKCLNRCGGTNSALLKLQRLNEKLKQNVAQLHCDTTSEIFDERYNSKFLNRLMNDAELLVLNRDPLNCKY